MLRVITRREHVSEQLDSRHAPENEPEKGEAPTPDWGGELMLKLARW